MLNFISWYILISVLGWLSFPTVYRLFPALRDHGYSISRAFGLLLWGYVFWLLASLGVLPNQVPGLLSALLLVVILSSLSIRTTGWEEFLSWIKQNKRLIFGVEVLFLAAFLGWTLVRAANPEAVGTEKPMELAFINAILRSEAFPPHDPWLSGYAISYYYFGYVLVAMLAKMTGTTGAVAFNLGISLIFALSAIGAYGLLYSLIRSTPKRPDRALTKSLLGPLFVLLVSNLEGFLHMLHTRGLFWRVAQDGSMQSNFWKWLDIKDLSSPPTQPFSWVPSRFWWWWRASRVLQDYDLARNVKEIIDEFPFFSYLLADLHPHVLSMPFVLLAMSLALNIYLGGGRGKFSSFKLSIQKSILSAARFLLPLIGLLAFGFGAIRLSFTLIMAGIISMFLGLWLIFYNYSSGSSGSQDEQLSPKAEVLQLKLHLDIQPITFLCASVVLGGLAFLNTWDFPFYVALFAGAYALQQARDNHLRLSKSFSSFIWMAVLLGISGGLLYLPFYLGFSSQAGGMIPNLIYATRGAHLWVMFAPLLVPLLVYLLLANKSRKNLRQGILIAVGLVFFLWSLSLLFGLAVLMIPEAGEFFMATLAAPDAITLFQASLVSRFANSGGWITMTLTLALTVSGLLKHESQSIELEGAVEPQEQTVLPRDNKVEPFVLWLTLLGAMLVLIPEFFYLRDQFGWRMNTIFKFYYQAWMMWAIAAAFAFHNLWENLKGKMGRIVNVLLALVLLAGLCYPVTSLWNKTNGFQPSQWTLDSTAYFAQQSPDEMAAISFLQTAPMGVVAEAIADSGGSYTQYARVSMLSGMPAVLGWIGHESQWRGGSEEMGTRQPDIKRLYCTRSWDEAREILQKYNIRYVFIAPLERDTYKPDGGLCPAGLIESKFAQHLEPLFQQGSVTIYEYITIDME